MLTRLIESRFELDEVVQAGAAMTIIRQLDVAWRCHTMGVSPESGPHFILESVKVENSEQLAGSDKVPCTVFSPADVGAFIDLETVPPFMRLLFVVRNITTEPRKFYGWIDGMSSKLPKGAIEVTQRRIYLKNDDFEGFRAAIRSGSHVRAYPNRKEGT